ncbi:helix-turn-helix domain-containing protein [Clostridium neuense]|uniref:Helix-turn-helix domain-containing protein n=1 Tax=Clostridium neuense TaxID=1728934 RepID=A0ABW8TG31_9CLOT
MEDTNVSFGKLIRHLRIDKNMSLKELSQITTLSKSYLSRLENEEKRNPTIFAVNKLGNALDLDIKTIEKLLVDEECHQDDEALEGIDKLLLNSTYTFAEKIATVEIQLLLRDIVRFLEVYCIKCNLSRQDEYELLELADKLRSVVLN